jgi:hypothetical protein
LKIASSEGLTPFRWSGNNKINLYFVLTLDFQRKEIKRIERRSPRIPKRYKFQKPRELENQSKDDSFMDDSWPRPVSVDLDKAIDLDHTGPSFDNSQQDEFNNAVTIETLFKGIEAKFENEISKSKQTFVDAKGTIDTLKKDFERFQGERNGVRNLPQTHI